ncbi:MAG TPA: copper resistance protein CopC [Gemmatimonadaceae bacterium]|nr:copper resistance protein CopC [Gemmatimonadaceae bacterium]
MIALAGRRARTRALLAAVLCALASLLPRAAHAHTKLLRSEPAKGARLDVAPRALRLAFNERVELAVSRLVLTGPGGEQVALSPLRSPGDSATVIVADIAGPLEAGHYSVAWQVAGRDGHPVRGTLDFDIAPGALGLALLPAVAETAAAAPPDSSRAAAAAALPPAERAASAGGRFDAESPVYAAVRWLGFIALLALVGCAVFALAIMPRAAGAIPGAALIERRAAGAAGVAAAALLVVAVARLFAQAVALHGGAEALSPALLASMLTGTLWGAGWLAQTGAAVVALVAARAARRDSATGWGVLAIAVVGAAAGTAFSGHAAAEARTAPLLVAADTLHILGAGGWIGTLLVLFTVGVPAAMRLDGGVRGAAVARMVNAFSPVALACAGLVLATGVIAATAHLGSWSALRHSRYGTVLLVKLAALALVAVLGAVNWRIVRPSLGGDAGAHRLRRTAGAELLLGAVVLAITAVLVATPLPTSG